MNTELISTIIGVFAGIGTLFAGIGFAYAQYKKGGDEADDRLISTLKESVTALEEKNKRLSEERSQIIVSHQDQITKLTGEIGELRGAFKEQQKKADEYKKILMGRDPEQLKILTEMREILVELRENFIKK